MIFPTQSSSALRAGSTASGNEVCVHLECDSGVGVPEAVGHSHHRDATSEQMAGVAVTKVMGRGRLR